MFKRKKSLQELKLELKQKKVTELIDKMLVSNIEVHNAPLSNEYFVLDRKNQVYIMIDLSSIKICNHKYRYEVQISGHESEKYIKKVKQKIQEHGENIKKELFKNEINLLDNISSIYTTKAKAEKVLKGKKYEQLVEENDAALKQLIHSKNGGTD